MRPAQKDHGPHLGTQVDPAEASEKIPFGVRNAVGEEGGLRLLEAAAKMSTNQKTVKSDAAESSISHAVDCVLCRWNDVLAPMTRVGAGTATSRPAVNALCCSLCQFVSCEA